MKYMNLFLSLTAICTVSALTIRNEVPAGYEVVPMTVTGRIEEGGEEMTFRGTAEDVIAQIEKLNPNFKEYADTLQSNTTTLVERELEARQPTRVACNGGGPNGGQSGTAQVKYLQDGINHLRWLSDFACGAPPRSCARMTCFNWYGSHSIWFCNDNDYDFNTRCDWSAYLADLVIEKCSTRTQADCWLGNPGCGRNAANCGCQDADIWRVMGAQYDVRNFNVMLVGQSHYC